MIIVIASTCVSVSCEHFSIKEDSVGSVSANDTILALYTNVGEFTACLKHKRRLLNEPLR